MSGGCRYESEYLAETCLISAITFYWLLQAVSHLDAPQILYQCSTMQPLLLSSRSSTFFSASAASYRFLKLRISFDDPSVRSQKVVVTNPHLHCGIDYAPG